MQGDREYTLYMRAGEEHYACDMYQELSCITIKSKVCHKSLYYNTW